MRLHMNSVMPCGTQVARRRHKALCEFCEKCRTPGRRLKLPTLQEIVEKRRQLRGAA